MEGLVITFSWLLLVAIGFLLWMRTKKGKKWLSNL